MPQALTQQRYTYDEWVDSPLNTIRGELADGVPVERMTTGADHSEVIRILNQWLVRADLAGYGRAYAAPGGVLLDPGGPRRHAREPDLYLFRPGRQIIRTRKGFEGVPDFVIEVLSPGNRSEQLPKGSIWNDYEQYGVPIYWIVDAETCTVDQYEHRSGSFTRVGRLGAGDVLVCPLFPALPLSVDDLFQNLGEIEPA